LEASLQRDIDLIRSKLGEMTALDEQALHQALKALLTGDRQSAYAVILRDQRIDELEKEIDQLCLTFLVRQQPVAGHLRFAYGTIKVNAELERIGDYAESIARQVLLVLPLDPVPAAEKFDELVGLAVPMFHDAVRAFVDRDAELARKTMGIEKQADALRNQIYGELVRAEREKRIPLEALTALMTIARRYERVADQAQNICEEALYVCTGEFAKHKAGSVLRIMFVDEHNACRSQMAEAIGNAFKRPELLFSSAGIEPRPVDPRTAGFLKEKGLDISSHVSKPVHHVAEHEHQQVVVALDRRARRAFPPPPTKTITLDWNVEDPSAAQGSDEEVRAAYQRVFDYLHAHIRDLIGAVTGNHLE
jgi:phosphate transport system protein